MLIIAPNELFDKKIIIMPPRLQIVQRAPEQIKMQAASIDRWMCKCH